MFRLSIAEPCTASWEDMRDADGGRFCGGCAKHVHDLSRVTKTRARALAAVYGSTGFCGRIVSDASGAAVFLPERAVTSPRVLPLRTAAAAMVFAAATGCAEQARPPLTIASGPSSEEPPAFIVAGEIVPPLDPDLDDDTVPNEVDNCPGTPGAPERNGCPRAVVVKLGGMRTTIPRTTFAFGTYQPGADSEALLDEIAKVLAEHPEIKRLAVEGHTSTDEPNGARLAESRAKAVIARLTKRGVDPRRLIPRGLADTRPIAPNTTRQGRESNRRVELHVEAEDDSASL